MIEMLIWINVWGRVWGCGGVGGVNKGLNGLRTDSIP